jgi:hypothetical protein
VCQDFTLRQIHADSHRHPQDDWHKRKKAYIKHLGTAHHDVLRVSLADKVHNARAILRDLRTDGVGEEIWSRFSQSRDDTLWYYQSLAKTFRNRLPGQLADELIEIVKDLGQKTREG